MSDQHLIGTEGDDFLQTAEGNDWLEGLGGNDVLLGGAGDDLYMPGTGADYISDFSGFDELRFAPGVSPDQVERIRPGGSYDLILRVAGTGEQVTIGGWFYGASYEIERVVFDDGTVWDTAETSSLRYLGSTGDDFLQGTEFDERLEGRGGNDVLLGGAGNDVYVPGFGGSDWVNDFAGDDELRLDGVSPDQIERIRQSGSYDLVLRVAGTGDQITLGGWFYDPANQIERVVFDDGTVWDAVETSALRRFGTAGDDFIQGTEYDERLEGRGGNDVLLGGAGNDVYVPGFGGSDWVNDFAGEDELRLEGVSPDQIERIRQSGSYDLVLRVTGSGDQITLGGWFYDAANQIERVVFDDGTVWNAVEAGQLRRFGTAGDDFIQGTEYDERLEGRGGNDVLLGGAGNDVYMPGVGGSDWISDFDGNDQMRMGAVSPDQVERIRQSGSYDLILRVVGTGDQITLGGWFFGAANEIELIWFDDGMTFFPWATSTTSALRRLGTAGDDFIQATEYDERLEGRGGSDVLLGGAGNDVYVPGVGGSDWINDFSGDDELRLNGVSPDQIERIRPADSDDLILRVAGTSDQVTLGGWFYDPANQIERVVFDDGTVWDPATTSTLGVGSNETPFVASPIADQSATENSGFSFAVPAGTFADPDAGDVLTLSARLAGGDPLPAWLFFDPATATFSGTPPFGSAGSVSVEVVATDSGGLSVSDQFDVAIAVGTNEIYGTEGNDLITGSLGNDLIWAGGGDDEVWGLEGHDAIYADYTATPGNDIVYGGGGSDFIYGGGGTDLLVGGPGDDSYAFISGSTQVVEYAGEGHDEIVVEDSYALPANVEDLRLAGAAVYGIGNDLANLILGTTGDNLIDGRGGADNMQAFGGNDTYVVDDPGDLVFESTASGVDTVESSITYTLGANLENLTLTGAAAIDGTGNGAVNVIRGNSAANTLRGESGNDSLYGFEGDDVLDGGLGHDTMVGGAGNDTYYFDFGSDAAIELAGEGIDTVISSIGIDLDENIENLLITDVAGYGGGNALDNIITGSAAGDYLVGHAGNDILYGGAGYDWLRGYDGDDSLYGQADIDDLFGFTGNDYLDGGEGNDRLDGGAGDDTMAGGTGDDLYIVDDDGDVVLEAAGEGVDTIESSLSGYLLPDEVENLTLVAQAASGTGNDAANVIIGNDLANSIAGRGGDDILIGGGGNDYMVDSGAGNDRLFGGAGSDLMIGMEGDDIYDPGFGGQDTVYDTGGDDEVRMGSVAPDQVERIRDGDHLVLRVAGTTESVTLYNWFSDLAWQIEQISFEDGTVWDAATTASLRYLGSAGDDFLQGSWYDELLEGRDGNDQIAGGYGSDTLAGGRGSDTYLFDWLTGDVDTVRESQADFFDVDTLRFVIWITPDDLVVTRDGLDLQVAIAGQDAAVRFEGWFDPGLSSHVERFEFQEGAIVISDWVVEQMINDAPVVANPVGGRIAAEDAVFSFSLPAETFADPDPYDSLTSTASLADGSALPSWLSFDSGTFSGTPANGDVGTISLRVTATDEQGLSASDIFVLSVTNTNDAPTLATSIADPGATEDAPFSFTFAADTFADEDLGDALGYTVNAMPGWLSFDPATRTFSGTPANGDVGTFSVRVTATDGSGASVFDEFDLAVANTNDAPVAVDDSFSVDEDWALWLGRFSLVTNDYDIDPTGDVLTIVSVQNAQHGMVILDEWQNTVFIPEANYYGPAGFQYTISDGNGGFATATVGVTILPVNDEPTVVNPISDQVATEDSPFSAAVPTNTFGDVESSSFTYSASLADDSPLPAWLSFDEPTATFSGTPANGDVGVLSVKVTAADAGGLSVSDVFELAIANTNDAPERGTPIPQQEAIEDAAFSFTLAADAFVDVDAGDTLTYAATQDDMFFSPLPAWLSFDPATRTFSGTPTNDDVGFVPIRVTATDSAGAQTFASFWLGVTNTNDAPTLANPIADQAASEDAAFSFTVPANTFADVDAGEFLTYSATLANGAALPGWLSFNFLTRTFTGTPLNADVGAVDVRVTASDSLAVSVSDVFRLSVVNTNDAPTLANAIADQNATEDAAFNFVIAAETFADIDVGDTLSYATDPLPAWLSFDAATRSFSGTPGNGDVGTVSVRIHATDASGATASDVFNITVANTNDAPMLANPIADQSATEDAPFSFTLAANTFADVDAGDTLSYSASRADGSALPSWLTLTSGTFSGTPTNGDVGTISVRVTATDAAGASASDVFDISVANTNDAPTLANPIADQNATEDATFSFTVPANAFADVDVGDFLDYAAAFADGTALPAWLLFDPGTRTFSGTPANGDVGTLSVRVIATDQSGASASDVFGIVVANTNDAPTLASAITDQTAQDTVAFSFTVAAGTFADVDAGDSLTYSTGALPSWLSFNAATRSFSGTPGSAHLGVVSLVVTATDSAGAQASDTFDITVGAAPDRTITGTAGNDTLNGASGNDTINGLGGADAMAGGLGNDAYFVDNAGDQVSEAAGAGNDTVNSSISHTLGANVENLVLTGTSNINATGNNLDNWLTGNGGKNTLAGGAGNDTYVVTQSNDSVVENAGNGADTVRASITYTLGNNVENLVLTGTAAINGTGNAVDNWLTGNGGSNILRGQDGADSISGGAGNDTLTGGTGLDTFWFLEAPGAANADHITDFGSGERLYLEDLVHSGIGAAGSFAPNDARFFAAPGASGGADASDRVIYDTTSGRLYFDADGSGAAAPSLIAILDNVFALSASNITVI